MYNWFSKVDLGSLSMQVVSTYLTAMDYFDELDHYVKFTKYCRKEEEEECEAAVLNISFQTATMSMICYMWRPFLEQSG